MSDIVDTLRNLARVHAAECLPPNSTGAAFERLIQESTPSKAANEIGRLRKKEKHLLKSRDDLFERIEGLDQEVERLCIDNVELTDEIADLGDQLERCTAHVGELELEAEGSHNITNAKIDAAWAEGEEVYCEASSFFESLRMLGIVRCERCGGTGFDGIEDRGGGYSEQSPCPSCNGRGWRKE